MTLNTLLSLIKCSAINISSVFHKPKLFLKKNCMPIHHSHVKCLHLRCCNMSIM